MLYAPAPAAAGAPFAPSAALRRSEGCPTVLASWEHSAERSPREEFAALNLCSPAADCTSFGQRVLNFPTASFHSAKNRYPNVLAKESTRVHLPVHSSDSDYINANFILDAKSYVAAQAPLPNCFGDFYAMLWSTRASLVMMLTNLAENGRRKADQYWPAEQHVPEQHGCFTVTLLSTIQAPEYALRVLQLERSFASLPVAPATNANVNANANANANGAAGYASGSDDDESCGDASSAGAQEVVVHERRIIYQFHYLGWEDFGVPSDPAGLIGMLLEANKLRVHAKKQQQLDGPMVVHCSAGLGRTGVLIAAHHLMERIRAGRPQGVLQTVQRLRMFRDGLVQTGDQYAFIYALLDMYASSLSTATAAAAAAAAAASSSSSPLSVDASATVSPNAGCSLDVSTSSTSCGDSASPMCCDDAPAVPQLVATGSYLGGSAAHRNRASLLSSVSSGSSTSVLSSPAAYKRFVQGASNGNGNGNGNGIGGVLGSAGSSGMGSPLSTGTGANSGMASPPSGSYNSVPASVPVPASSSSSSSSAKRGGTSAKDCGSAPSELCAH